MSEKFGLKDKELAELAGKIETELPSELAQTLSFYAMLGKEQIIDQFLNDLRNNPKEGEK
jgi:hypothetical protein